MESNQLQDKKELVEQIVAETGLKEKIDAAFSELEEKAKKKLIAELEAAVRKKLEKEYEKKVEEIKKKAKKRVRKALVASAVCACSVTLLLNLKRIFPQLSQTTNQK